VRIAPSGAAKEKMIRRFRTWGGVRERERRVVVSPRAVGPVVPHQLNAGHVVGLRDPDFILLI